MHFITYFTRSSSLFPWSWLVTLTILGCGTTVHAEPAQIHWQASLGLNQEQHTRALDAAGDLDARMRRVAVAAKVSEGRLELSGDQGLDQVRTALFDTAAEWADFLGGPIEVTLEMPDAETPITLELESRITTGYGWEVITEPGKRFSQRGQAAVASRYRAYGAPAIQTLVLQPAGSGDGTVRLLYRRAFQKEAPIKTRLHLSVPGEVGELRLIDPTPTEPEERRAAEPDDSTDASAEPSTETTRGLPTAWDWRNLGVVTPVRDQGGCGSCWAFGTVGVMESAVLMGGGPPTDLSEQFLVSCNLEGWSCGGGLTASMYHYNKLGESQTAAGAVLESTKPYTATNGTCAVALSHPYRLSGWKFITGSEWIVPSVEAIKTAIYTYGPITAGVCVDIGWDSYTGGVYAPAVNICGGSTNHQIVLVGWDDATQTWILRNSWGPYWGDNGYMHIKYDPAGTTSRVGEGTSWAKYQAPAIPLSPAPASTASPIIPSIHYLLTN